jgi:hypothetical protein
MGAGPPAEETNGPPAPAVSPRPEPTQSRHHGTPYTTSQKSGNSPQNQQSSGISAATSAMSAAASWLNRVGHLARDYAVVAGQHIDRAAESINASVDHYAQQV